MRFVRPQLFLLLLLFSLASPTLATERILDFESQVIIDPSGLLHVTEQITVTVEGKAIKHGIYRDFPTRYTDSFGRNVTVDFNVREVKRGDRSEPYHLKKLGNGVRVYIGNANVFLERGKYHYTLSYTTARQIGFFDDYDELNWNVTGNDWAFPIDHAGFTLVLPKGGRVIQWSVYTGPKGSKAGNASLLKEEGNVVSFATNRPLMPREGFTVAVAFPKGLVREPDRREQITYLVHDNLTLLAGSVGLLILLVYYLIAWLAVGRDPSSGTIIPRFKPPSDLTPAAARFISRMRFDDRSFAAALVDMAVKGHVRIEQNNGVFVIHRERSAREELSRGERKVMNKLLSGDDSITLKKSNHQRISGAQQALRTSLRNDFERLHFRRNRIYLVPGVIITLVVIATIIFTARDRPSAAFMSVWLSMWSVGCFFLLAQTIAAWRNVFRPSGGTLTRAGNIVGALFFSAFSLPFFGGWFFGAGVMVKALSLLPAVVLLVILGVNFLFYSLLKAPTVLGRKMLDKIEGFKLYLTMAEEKRLNMLNPPDKTPELFERFLPWALALGVEQEWAEQFSDVLAAAKVDGGQYHPAWYSGATDFSPTAMVGGLGPALASSIASSSTAPGSSSGSGGGGSSGGGGGGGGGGGW